MGASRRRPGTPLEERLFSEPHRFGFFQAVRLLEARARSAAGRSPEKRAAPVGGDEFPRNEVVRFSAHPSTSFPPTEVTSLVPAEDPDAPPELSVAFLGLIGPTGALPVHYTRTVISRGRQRDHSLRHFLDLFNHRITSLFYRIWEKYRIDGGSGAGGGPDEFISWCLQCLVGFGVPALTGRTHVHDDAFVRYAGHYARAIPTAAGLEDLLADYFDLPVEVVQFSGEWLHLRREDRTRLPLGDGSGAQHNRLGQGTVLGQQIWDVRGNFRIRLGPMPLDRYRSFLPGADGLLELTDLVQVYVGPGLGFEAQPVLDRRAAPPAILDTSGPAPPRLGYDIWLRAEPMDEPFDGASFAP